MARNATKPAKSATTKVPSMAKKPVPLAQMEFVRDEEKKTCWKYLGVHNGGPRLFVGNEDTIWPRKDLLTGVGPKDRLLVTIEVIPG